MPRFPLIAAVFILIALSAAACQDAIPEAEPRPLEAVAAQSQPAADRFEPVVAGRTRVDNRLFYHATEQDSSVISTYVSNTLAWSSDITGTKRFQVSCFGRLRMYIVTLPVVNAERAVFLVQLDDQPVQETTEQLALSYTKTGTKPAGSSVLLSHKWYEPLKSASTFSIRLRDSDMPAITFDLTGMFETPVQPNLDNCFEHRLVSDAEAAWTYVPVISASGTVSRVRHSANNWYRATRERGGSISTLIQIPPINSPVASETGLISLSKFCSTLSGTASYRLAGLPALEADSASVVFHLGRDSQHEATLEVSTFRGSSGHPAFPASSSILLTNFPDLISELRSASTLTITLPETDLEPLIFDLSEFFSTPMQGNIDHCGQYKPFETRTLAAVR